MVEISWTAESEKWLRDIHDYISADNPTAARKTIKGIYGSVQSLRRFPRTGYRYEHSHRGEVRISLYGHYRVAYLIKDDEHIDILGVYHGALDIERYLW